MLANTAKLARFLHISTVIYGLNLGASPQADFAKVALATTAELACPARPGAHAYYSYQAGKSGLGQGRTHQYIST